MTNSYKRTTQPHEDTASTAKLPTLKRRRLDNDTDESHDNKKDNNGSNHAEAAAAAPQHSPEENCETTKKQEPVHIPKEKNVEKKKNTPTTLHTSTVYISGLHPRVSQAHLEKLLRKFGTIERLQVVVPKASSHGRIAFCDYQTIPQAQSAISALHEQSLLGQTLQVQPAHERKKRQFGGSSLPPRRSVQAQERAIASKIAQVQQQLQKLQNKKK